MTRFLRPVGAVLLWIVILALLATVIVPRFLDRRYYGGPVSGHFDGQRFFNPDGDDTARVPGGGGRFGFLWRQSTGSDGRPAWPATVAVRTARPAERVAGERMVATWIGHATVLVQSAGLNILTDPVWSDRAGPFGFGPKRVAEPGVAFDDLPTIDIVLISHNHYDHLDLATLKRLSARDRPLVVTSLGNGAILRSAGIPAVELDWKQAAVLTGAGVEVARSGALRCGPDAACPGDRATIMVTRNHHWSSRWFADRNRALWSSFLIRLPGGNIFFAGDTGFGDGRWASEASRFGPVRLALLPIGAFRFEPGQMATGSHIGPVDAVEVYRRLGAQTAIPIHWGTFRLSYEAYDTPPRLLEAATRCAAQQGFAPVAIGASVSVPPVAGAPRAPPVADRASLLRCLDTPAVRALR